MGRVVIGYSSSMGYFELRKQSSYYVNLTGVLIKNLTAFTLKPLVQCTGLQRPAVQLFVVIPRITFPTEDSANHLIVVELINLEIDVMKDAYEKMFHIIRA